MKAIWILTKKELVTFFDSLTAYVLLVIFLGLSGFFTWISGSDIFLIGQVTLQPFFSVAYWTLFFFIPALTMRMLAEENRTGTIELLQTKAITDWQIVIGKSLACLLLIAIALIFTLPYYITLTQLGDVDHGAVLCGYLGLILMSCSYIGIGMLASSITSNQIVAFLVSLLIGVFFLIIFDVLSSGSLGVMADIFHYLSISNHFESISRGVIDTKDVVYFLLIALAGLVLAEFVLAKRNIIS
ncbi:MAG: ABC transporter permease [Chitinophagales bacterium]|nr:MAG: ABC transporter permease [Chitinophagales bacterium]